MIINNFEQLENFKNIPGIYKFRFITNFNKQYCGEGDDLYDRLVRQYPQEIKKLEKNKKTRPLIKAIKKYGWENIEIEIIDYGEHLRDKDTRIALETACIIEYNSLIKNEHGILGHGYNVSLGGMNMKGYKHTKETRKRMSEINGKNMLGKHHSEATKEKMRNKIITEKTKKQLSESGKKLYQNGYINPRKGKHLTDETKNKLSIAHTGKTLSEQHKLNISKNNASKRKVKQLDLEGNLIKIWDSITEAAKFLNIIGNESPITKVCRGKRKQSCGFKWEYVENS